MLNRLLADRVLDALGDPTRRAMVDALAAGAKSVTELAVPLEISLAAVVQHIDVLQRSGLVHTEKKGRVRVCRLDARGLDELERWVRDRRAQWNRHLDRLGQYLDGEGANRKGKGK